MKYIFRRTYIMGTVLLMAFLVSGCGGSKSSGNSTTSGDSITPGSSTITSAKTFTTLASGTNVDISAYNGTNIYTLVTRMPSDKPESDSQTANSSSFTLSSSAGIIQSEAAAALPSMALSHHLVRGVYGAKQAALDNLLRKKEQALLAKKTKQMSKSNLLAKSTAVSLGSNIAAGTPWNDVYVYNTQTMVLTTINTTCRYVSSKACFFVENNYESVIQPYLAAYGTAFDTIYSQNTGKFGPANDVDGNGKVIVVFSGKISNGVLGYFNADDKFAQTQYYDSNQGDIFYLTADATIDGMAIQGDIMKGTMAHEFQHMIYFDQHANNGVTYTYTWLNEALSQAAEYYSGYKDNHEAWMADFLSGGYEGLSLTHWTDNNYGYGAIFIRYLIDQYGDAAIKKMCATGKVGIAAVEDATGVDFNVIFRNFVCALTMAGTGDSSNSLYNFTSLNLQTLQSKGRRGLLPSSLSPQLTAGSSKSAEVPPYGLMFYKWSGTFGTVTLSSNDGASGLVFGLSR